MNNLSLVLTSYNRLSFLKKMIVSIQNQSDLKFDLIICDNHSTDGSWEFINNLTKFNDGIFLKLHWPENLGWAGSASEWNAYIKTEWASILSDDDWLGNNFVLSANTAISNLSFDFSGLIVLGHLRINDKTNLSKKYNYSSKLLNINEAIKDFYSNKFDVAGISGFVLKSEILKNEFPQYYEGGFLEDTMIIYRAILKSGAFFVNGIHYYRREGHESLGNIDTASILYRLALIKFKKDLKPYANASSCNQRLQKKILRYTTYDHIKGIVKVILLKKINLNLYLKLIRNVSRRRYYELLLFYPILFVISIFSLLWKK
jgi:glycosyltransferase involved in cell wall biosynthesis